MIIVKRITGESFDLETGEQIPKTLVLSNGEREATIIIDDAAALTVVKLMVSDHELDDVPAEGGESFTLADSDDDPELKLSRTAEGAFGEWDDHESGIASI